MTILRRTTPLVFAYALAALVAFTIEAQEGEYGTIPSAFKVTQLGEASYSMAIDMPEGPGGVRPPLSLAYRHRSGDGPLGVGWQLAGLSQITRCPQTVAQDGQARDIRYDSGDRFCLDGRRLVVISGTYGAAGSEYRTELETFRKVVAFGQQGGGPAYFVVTDRDGTQSWYGAFYGSSLVDGGTGSHRQWALNTVRDPYNNDIEFHWTTGTAGELLPSSIEYGKNLPQGLSAAQYRASFVYEDKPAAHRRTGAHWGAPVASTKRLKTLSVDHMSGSWQVVRRYELGYMPESAAPHRSLLEKVQLCGTTTCINGSWFTWGDGQINASGFGSQRWPTTG